MTSKIDFGKIGEDLAVELLVNKGYRILDRNWRSGHKEIDIVAMDGDILVVVEVKTRKTNSFGDPDIAVGVLKQRLLAWAADAYIRYHNLDVNIRFDVVSIVITDKKHIIEHIEDAFVVSVNSVY